MSLNDRIRSASTVDDFIACDRELRAVERAKPEEYIEMLGILNSRSAGFMFALQSLMAEDYGAAHRIVAEASKFKAAGYPKLSTGALEAYRRLAAGGSRFPEIGFSMRQELQLNEDDVVVIETLLSTEPRQADGVVEICWTDIWCTPTGQAALRALRKLMSDADELKGSEVYEVLTEFAVAATTNEALVAAEAEAIALQGEERRLFQKVVTMRRMQLAGQAVSRINDLFGWWGVRALFARGDIKGALLDGKLVGEFLSLGKSIAAAVTMVRDEDEPLARSLVSGAWNRASARLAEGEVTAGIRERLAALPKPTE